MVPFIPLVLVAGQLFASGPCPNGRCPRVQRVTVNPVVVAQVAPQDVTPVVPADAVPEVASTPPSVPNGTPVVQSSPVCRKVVVRRGFLSRCRNRCRRWCR